MAAPYRAWPSSGPCLSRRSSSSCLSALYAKGVVRVGSHEVAGHASDADHDDAERVESGVAARHAVHLRSRLLDVLPGRELARVDLGLEVGAGG